MKILRKIILHFVFDSFHHLAVLLRSLGCSHVLVILHNKFGLVLYFVGGVVWSARIIH